MTMVTPREGLFAGSLWSQLEDRGCEIHGLNDITNALASLDEAEREVIFAQARSIAADPQALDLATEAWGRSPELIDIATERTNRAIAEGKSLADLSSSLRSLLAN